jgi:hypothetical protein
LGRSEAVTLPLAGQKKHTQNRIFVENKKVKKQQARYINGIGYSSKHRLNWIDYTKKQDGKIESYFAYVTNIKIYSANAWDIILHGRMRWIIENQGFNTQKNGGYEMQHKYSRKYYWAMKNYYQLLQIAHMIAQLVEKLEQTRQTIEETAMTLLAAYEDMVATMIKECIEHSELQCQLENTRQLRY